MVNLPLMDKHRLALHGQEVQGTACSDGGAVDVALFDAGGADKLLATERDMHRLAQGAFPCSALGTYTGQTRPRAATPLATPTLFRSTSDIFLSLPGVLRGTIFLMAAVLNKLALYMAISMPGTRM